MRKGGHFHLPDLLVRDQGEIGLDQYEDYIVHLGRGCAHDGRFRGLRNHLVYFRLLLRAQSLREQPADPVNPEPPDKAGVEGVVGGIQLPGSPVGQHVGLEKLREGFGGMGGIVVAGRKEQQQEECPQEAQCSRDRADPSGQLQVKRNIQPYDQEIIQVNPPEAAHQRSQQSAVAKVAYFGQGRQGHVGVEIASIEYVRHGNRPAESEADGERP